MRKNLLLLEKKTDDVSRNKVSGGVFSFDLYDNFLRVENLVLLSYVE